MPGTASQLQKGSEKEQEEGIAKPLLRQLFVYVSARQGTISIYTLYPWLFTAN